MKITKNKDRIFKSTTRIQKYIKQDTTTNYVLGPNDTLVSV